MCTISQMSTIPKAVLYYYPRSIWSAVSEQALSVDILRSPLLGYDFSPSHFVNLSLGVVISFSSLSGKRRVTEMTNWI